MLGDIYKKVILVKSVVTLPDEAIGYLKGDLSEKNGSTYDVIYL